MKKKGRVFVIQDLGFSYEDAEENFGELVFLLERKEASAFNIARVSALLKKRLWDNEFSGSDYLLALGSPAMIMLAGILSQRIIGSGNLNVLQWDRVEKKYYLVELRI